jgi:hypothetical protein
MVLEGVGGDLPIRLGGAQVPHRGALGFDVYVDGVPFLLAVTDEVAFVDRTAAWRKEQFDAQPEPGEQSLSDWWTRSQLSFHGGAGQKFLDSYADGDEMNRLRFDASFNVEVHEPGVVTTLPAAETILTQTGGIGPGFIFTFTDDDGYRWVLATDGDLIRWWKDTVSGPLTGSLSHGSAFTIQAACTDGERLYVASEGGVFAVGQDLTPVQLYSVPGSPPKLALGWAKQRLMLGVDASVYELLAAGDTTLPSPTYTHPTDGWVWDCFADGPTSILVAGHAGSNSAIFEFALEEVGDAPALGAGQVAAAMPFGEVVHSLFSYSGAWLGIGTSKGLRVGRFDEYYGTLTYGPLSIETVTPVRGIAGVDRFLFCGLESLDGYSSCLAKLDLGMPLDQAGRYAWSPHQPPPALTQAPIRHVTVDDLGLLLFSVDGVGTVRQDPTEDTALAAWIATSKIRMGTLEPKNFRYMRVRAELDGEQTIVSSAVTSAGDLGTLLTLRAGREPERFRVGSRGEWASLRFDLSPGARLTGYTLYALPAQERYRVFQVPMLLANSERSRSGQVFSTPRWAQERFTALKEIESRGDEVELLMPAFGYEAQRGTIEETTMVQTNPPTDRGANGLAGVVQIVFRTTT